MKTMTFLTGAAVGYLLGTRAGRERYQQIAGSARRLANQPVLKQPQANLKDLAEEGADVIAAKLGSEDPVDLEDNRTEGSAKARARKVRTASASAARAVPAVGPA